MAEEPEKLKTGKGAAFVKSRLRSLPREDDAWEVGFEALPKATAHTERPYRGVVVTYPGSVLLADRLIEHPPTVNDLATLVADAMRDPHAGKAHRPQQILVIADQRWRELFDALKGLGVEVHLRTALPRVEEANAAYVRRLKTERSDGKAGAAGPPTMEEAFPAIARWMNDGYIQIGEQEGRAMLARALNYDGVVFEIDTATTLSEAMAALERSLGVWYDEQASQLE